MGLVVIFGQLATIVILTLPLLLLLFLLHHLLSRLNNRLSCPCSEDTALKPYLSHLIFLLLHTMNLSEE